MHGQMRMCARLTTVAHSSKFSQQCDSITGADAECRLFFKREMELALIGLNYAGKSTLVEVLASGTFNQDLYTTVCHTRTLLGWSQIQSLHCASHRAGVPARPARIWTTYRRAYCSCNQAVQSWRSNRCLNDETARR